jgi:histidinol-phosphate aminotransferase
MPFQSLPLSRRAFAQLFGAGTAALAMPPLLFASPVEQSAAAVVDGVVRLSSNENPYGPSPKAIEAMRDAFGLAWRYPDEQNDALIDAISSLLEVESDHILLGDGSSEILKDAASAFAGPGRTLVMAEPTFEAIGAYARASGAGVVKVPLTPTHGHDLERMIAAAGQRGLIYVCNPNNPTATITPKGQIREALAKAPQSVTLLIDEAYHHYADSSDYESVVPFVRQHPNLIVARTFSKVYGMAGLRCGYCVASPATVRAMRAQGMWDSVNIMALTAARASLGDRAHVTEGQRRNAETRAWLGEEMKRSGYSMLPSQANFVMIDIRREVKPVIAALRERQVHVGRLFPAMPRHLRVTLGTRPQMDRFLKAFGEVMGPLS